MGRNNHVLLAISALIIASLGAGCGDDGSDGTGGSAGTGGSVGSGGTNSTAAVLCDFSQTFENDDESVNDTSTSTWSCADDVRNLLANGIPDHAVGTFPNELNPNAITAQDLDVDFPLTPEIVSETGARVVTAAYALNGIKVEVGTGGTCTDEGECAGGGNGGAWNMEALGAGAFDFGTDENNAHVQPTGQYHYHGIPEAYVDDLGLGEAMTFVGWAVDGFPIYARYTYSDATDSASGIAVVTSSYQLKSEPDEGRPDVSVYPLGAFTQDYEFVTDSGDLDACNGRTGVTPEFPDGIYHYYITDTFPFGPRCVKGTTIGGGPMGPPPDGDDAGPPA